MSVYDDVDIDLSRIYNVTNFYDADGCIYPSTFCPEKAEEYLQSSCCCEPADVQLEIASFCDAMKRVPDYMRCVSSANKALYLYYHLDAVANAVGCHSAWLRSNECALSFHSYTYDFESGGAMFETVGSPLVLHFYFYPSW